MSTHAGILRSSFEYIGDTVEQTIGSLLFFGVLCSPVIVFGLLSSSIDGVLLFASYFGLAIYFAQLHIGGNVQSAGETSNSSTEKRVLSLLLFVYYNLVVFVGGLVGYLAWLDGGLALGLPVALLVPFVDGEVSRSSMPLSMGGVVLAIVWLLRKLLGVVGYVRDVTETTDWLDEFLQKITPSALQEVSVARFDRAMADWV